MGAVSLLDRHVMTAREAARQLRIPETTLIHWLEGEQRRGAWYPPVLREAPTGSAHITWGEMVEARYLREYRSRNVSMQRLRPFIADMWQKFGLPYPLAHLKPFTSGRRLLLEAQDQQHLPQALRMIYEVSTGQLILDPRVIGFLERVDFSEEDGQAAERIRPAGKDSPVVIDPRIASGASSVRGTRTEILAELANAGASVDEIAKDFRLPVHLVKSALSYEWSAPSAA